MRGVRFVTTHDGLSLAWTRTGAGPPLVKAAAWLSHLEHDGQSPIWAHYARLFSENFDYLRYDERGCGMSDRETGQLDIDSWTDDLARVIEAADMPRPFALIAMSQGTGAAVRYAAEHPEDISHLILVGGYARGAHKRGDDRAADLYRKVTGIFGAGFDDRNPAFREVFTRRFIPDADPEKIGWFNDLCRRTTDAETGARLLAARGDMDVSDWLGRVQCPTLILHAKGDGVAPMAEGRLLAQRIPNAELRVLESDNHILQADEPAWQDVEEAVLAFTGAGGPPEIADLTPREQAILAEIRAAKSNKDIARTLDMSEKTVRNHATRIFAKLGVSTRQEAILKLQNRP